MKNKLIAIIPVHLNSQRFPRKALYAIHGLPMVEHVRRRALISNCFDRVIVATCDDEIARSLDQYNADIIMTSKEHLNGTSRAIEVSENIDSDLICLLQGDEPTLPPKEISEFILNVSCDKDADAWNAIAKIKKTADLNNKSFVKAAVSENFKIDYCFRRSTSHLPLATQQKYIYKILGLICFSNKSLKLFASKSPSIIEQHESIEQIRLIEMQLFLRGILLERPYPSINEKSDESDVLEFLSNKHQSEDLQKVLDFDV